MPRSNTSKNADEKTTESDKKAKGSNKKSTYSEEFSVKGDALVKKLKELIKEGNIRKITIKNEKGKILMKIPLTIGVFGALLLPVWAALGAVAALVANMTIVVERGEE